MTIGRISMYASALALSLFLSAAASATMITGSASPNGAQEVPAVSTMASGTFLIDWDDMNTVSMADDTYEVSGVIANLTPAQITGMHIHNGIVGVNGPIVQSLSADGVILSPFGSGTLVTLSGASVNTAAPAVNYTDLLAGDYYVNVHTTANPGGVIRGQIAATIPEPSSLALLLVGAVFAIRRRR